MRFGEPVSGSLMISEPARTAIAEQRMLIQCGSTSSRKASAEIKRLKQQNCCGRKLRFGQEMKVGRVVLPHGA